MSIQIFDPTISKEVAETLLKVGAIKLNPDQPFTWASGMRSPIYCDNRISLSFPEERSFIKEKLAKAIKKHFVEAAAIAGVATAGIPQGALVADALHLPFLYVRSKSKTHGLTNQIEGKIVPGQKVVVVEDLVSTGGSSLAAVEALERAGIEVIGMMAIFTYGFQRAVDAFNEKKLPLVVLSDYSTLVNQSEFSDQTKNVLTNWKNDPDGWWKSV